MTNANQMELKKGRSAMWGIEADLLSEICKTPGDHIEIGTLWGASAIIAALAKPAPARVFSIDIMERGYWVDGDPACDFAIPTARDILVNFRDAGVADRVTLVCSNSSPFPFPDLRPSTALIDGGHNKEFVKRDWLSLSPITSRFVAIHDYGDRHPDVKLFVDLVVCKNPDWQIHKLANSLLVMERVQ